jgi:putative membrane protein
MKRFLLPLSLLFGTAVFISCGGGEETETETDTTTTTTITDTTTTTGGPTTPTYSATPLTGEDTTFAKEAASGGMMEVELGRLAQQNATNPRVKSFGEMMVRDHSAANDELKRLTTVKNMMLSDSMMKKHKDNMEKLRKATGKDFDKRYMELMVKDHTEDVRKFEKASTGATDADLKAWAGKTLPILRMHLDSAKAINQSKM